MEARADAPPAPTAIRRAADDDAPRARRRRAPPPPGGPRLAPHPPAPAPPAPRPARGAPGGPPPRQRQAVFDSLARADGRHPTAEEVYQDVRRDLPSLSLATVYKALEALVSAGLVSKLADGDGPA